MKRQKGFTLIELMIVVAIIAILAALIVPNLMQNRIQANETSAMGSLRTYASAQFTFQRGKFSALEGNAIEGDEGPVPGRYADNFSNLFYAVGAEGSEDPLQLINKTFADARSDTLEAPATATVDAAVDVGTFSPYQGYVFNEDQTWITADPEAWSTNFGLIAYPGGYATTGYNCYWIGVQGVILQQNVNADSGTVPDEFEANTPYPTGTDSTNAWVVAG